MTGEMKCTCGAPSQAHTMQCAKCEWEMRARQRDDTEARAAALLEVQREAERRWQAASDEARQINIAAGRGNTPWGIVRNDTLFDEWREFARRVEVKRLKMLDLPTGSEVRE